MQRAANEAWLIKKIATNNKTHADQTYAPHMHVPHTNQSNCMFFVSFCQWHCKQSKLDELLDVRQRHLLCYTCICAVCSVSMFIGSRMGDGIWMYAIATVVLVRGVVVLSNKDREPSEGLGSLCLVFSVLSFCTVVYSQPYVRQRFAYFFVDYFIFYLPVVDCHLFHSTFFSLGVRGFFVFNNRQWWIE